MSRNLLVETDLIKKLESEVHVYFCFPDTVTDKSNIDEYYSILSTDEQNKYSRFHFEKDRHSYLVSHALVRKVLSLYGGLQPEQWCFEFNSYGKPTVSLDDKFDIEFNLSHTDGLSAVVVTLDCDCGVDVENVQRKSKSLAVAERMFAEPEVEVMRSSNETIRQQKFFQYWTLREAYVKAIGTGLGGSSKDFYFSVDEKVNYDVEHSEKTASIHFEKTINVNDIEGADKQWQFSLLTPSENHIAALAVLKKNEMKKKVVSAILQL